jgi:DNA-directed RNA polymerase specialized sigma24 family protein
MCRPKSPVRILFDRCAQGDEPAWREFLRRFGPTVRRSVKLVLGARACPTDVEDFTQDIYCALLAQGGHRLRAFRGATECSASGFIARTAERLARDGARVERRRKRLGWGSWTLLYLAASHTVPDPGPGPEARALDTERRRRLAAGLRAVTPESLAARLVEMAVFGGWGSRDLARLSRGRYTSGNIDTLLSRARQRLAPQGMHLPVRYGSVPAVVRRAA